MKFKLVLVTVLGFLTMVVPYASAQFTPSRASARQTETLLIRIETKIDVLKGEAERIAARNPQIGEYLSTLEQSVTKLQDTLRNRGPITNDLNDVLTNATLIDQYLAKNRVTTSAQSQWGSLKTDFTSLATTNNINWDWNKPVTPVNAPTDIFTTTTTESTYTAPESQVRTLLSRLALKTTNYKTQMDAALKADTIADLPDTTVSGYIGGLETAGRRLQQQFDGRKSTSADAKEVLTRATYLDQFMTRNRLNSQAQAQWRNLKADLNTLATYYNVNWDWNQKLPSDTSTAGVDPKNFDTALTGTYKLNTSLSEGTAAAIDKALGSTPAGERANSRRRLEQRLKSPDSIAIEKKNSTVTMASGNLPKVTFEADGVARSETNARGRTVTTTATADEDGLIINYLGERSSDFYMTFLPMADGRLKVTRKIYVDNGNNSITVSSVYDKIDNTARWNTANDDIFGTAGAPSTPTTTSTVNESFVVPSGTRLSAELQSAITGSGSGETFTMEVRTPSQYRGAIIGGRVVSEDAASKVAGRSRVILVFDTIRLTNGQTYKFAGGIDSVTTASGEPVTVTNQAAKTGTPAPAPKKGIGGVLGTVLGAISGTPADAAVNTSTTAGSVLTQNRDTIDIGSGSQFAITSTSTGAVTSPK